MPTSFDFGAAIAEVLSSLVDDRDVRDAVLERLVEPDGLAAISETVHDMLVGPIEANRMGSADGISAPLTSREQAEIITAAIAEGLRPHAGSLPSEQVLAGQVAKLQYKDWRFELIKIGGHPAVRVVATVENAYKPEATFTTSRPVLVKTSVAEAALQAVLSIEEHEARERLSLGGRRVVSPHDPGPLPAGLRDALRHKF